jgi:DNA modification methylase
MKENKRLSERGGAAVRVERFVGRHSWAILILGDCLTMLDEYPCDAVISNPPYGIKHKSSYGASWAGTEIAGDGCTTARDTVWNHFKEKPRAMFGISWMQPPPPDVRMSIIWDKGAAFGAGDLRIPWKPCWEEIYIGGHGWKGRRDEGVLRGGCVPSWESGPAHDGNGRKHPHQKPVWLMARLIEKLPDASVIFDPFMGSGTTGVACLRLHRNFIGIERDATYYKTACDRIAHELDGALL